MQTQETDGAKALQKGCCLDGVWLLRLWVIAAVFFPGLAWAAAGFPAGACRAGFVLEGARLCISDAQDAEPYLVAAARCRDMRAGLCGSEELRYIYFFTTHDADYNPDGKWLGDFVGDDTVLCGNAVIDRDDDPNRTNFEGTCNKSGSRSFWCCHDRE